jgi:hypothetical protein
VRAYGVPEMLVSDNGSIFTSHATRHLCEHLGIEKKEIKKGKPYQNYIETFLYVIWNLNVSENCQDNVYYVDLTLASSAVFKDNEGQIHIINVQRRMADWSFEKAQTYEDLLAAHEKWHRDYNHQKHLAHEKRDDGCHSPAAVLGWVKGMQPEPDLLYRAFGAICETRTLTKAGYAKFRNFLLYGEQGLVVN